MDIILRAAVVFVVLLVVMRLVGRRELSSLQPFDLILLIVIGDFVQQAVTQNDVSVTGAVLAVGTIAILAVCTSWLGYRFTFFRSLLEGRPIVLVERGEPILRNLRRERITLEELAAQARLQQIESLEQVRWAVLETSGAISFIPEQPPS